MKTIFTSFIVAALSSLGIAHSAWAATVTDTFNVTINVQPSCEFTTPPAEMGFGSTAASASKTATTTFGIQCTVGTGPAISLTSDNGWNLKGVDADNDTATIPYKLYSDATWSTVWNDVSTATAITDGTVQSFTVYGKVADTGVTAGNFKDVVTVTLTY